MASIYRHQWADGKTVTWTAFWRDQSGKQHKKRFPTRRDAHAFLVETEKMVADHTFTTLKPRPMKEVFEKWLEDLETRENLGEIKPSTATGYRCGVRTFIEEFGGYRSDSLSAEAIAGWRARQAERIAAGEMSAKSYNNGHNLLHNILAWARHPARSYLRHDPMSGLKRVSYRKKEADFLEDKEQAALLGAVAGNPCDNAIVHVCLFAGLRRGEALGLKWSDIERARGPGGRLKVRRSVYQGKVTRPKTASSERVVDIPQRVLDVLEAHREANPSDSEWIFPSRNGETSLDGDNWYKRSFAKIRKAAGLRPSVGLHSLRHTFASLLIRNGENLKYVSHQMGHASASFTADCYGHLFASQSSEAMVRLEASIPAPAKPEPEKPALRVVRGGAA